MSVEQRGTETSTEKTFRAFLGNDPVITSMLNSAVWNNVAC